MSTERTLGEALFELGHDLQRSGVISDASQIFTGQELPEEAGLLREICIATITSAEPIINDAERWRRNSRLKTIYFD